MADVFLSYSRDDVSVAQCFRDALAVHGFDVWWDVDLRTGVAYDEVTEHALRGARATIVLWSPVSVASRWVRAEATLAQSNKTFLPVMIADCQRPIMFELTQTPDLSAWKGNVADPVWRRFVADVDGFIAHGRDGQDADVPASVQLARGAAFALPDKPSIAVLPFSELGEDRGDFFADGVAEEISTALSHFQTLFVIAAASSLTCRDPDREPAQICRALGVRYLLDGSIRRSGNRVRITARLADGIAGEQIWADKFDDTLDDIFDLQDRVATAVAARIDSSIDTAELKRIGQRPTNSADATELYWRANAIFRRLDKASLLEAIALTEQVMEIDSGNAWAASLCAFCHASMFANGSSDDPGASRAKALELYERAMRNGGDDARVLGYCGAALTSAAGDPVVATRLIDRTLEINPGSATSLFWGGWNDIVMGRPDRGYERLETALRLNPLSIVRPMTVTAMGICRLFQHRFDEAAAILSEASQQVAHFPAVWAALTAALAHAGRIAEARAARVRLKDFNDSWGVLALMRAPPQTDLLREGLEMANVS